MDQQLIKFNSLLTHLAETLGLGDVEKVSDDVCSFGSNDTFITLIRQHETIIFLTNVGNMPQDTTSTQIKDILLDANVLYRGTRGGTLGVEESGVISYCYQCSLTELTNETFLVILENYISVAEKWSEHIASMIKGEFNTVEEIFTPNNMESWIKI